MLVSTVQGIRDELAVRLNEAETDNTDQYTNWINFAVYDIQTSFPNAPFLRTSADRTLSSGTRVYTNLPSDFYKMNTITYPAGDVRLSYLDPEEFDTLQPSATEGGTPTIYTIRGQGSTARIEYYPVPGSSLTVHLDYDKSMTTVSASSAVVDVPVAYLDLVLLYGEYRGLRRRGDYANSNIVNQEYQLLKDRLKSDLIKQVTENSRIKSVREFQQAAGTFDDPIRNIFHSNL